MARHQTDAGIPQGIIDFIRDFWHKNGNSPTAREIMHGANLHSTSMVQKHLDMLEEAGVITRGKGTKRTIRIVGDSQRTAEASVPLLGRIAAGRPAPVLSDLTLSSAEKVALRLELAGGTKERYALKVAGHSMIDAMIDDGDTVIMERITKPKNGDLVAVWLKNEEETTIKKIYFEKNGRVRLQPCNPYMAPLYFPGENVEVQGKVVGVIRNCG
jgi:repressor LexA